MIVIEINNQQSALDVDAPRTTQAIENVLADGGFEDGEISVAVINDPSMHVLNRRYLDHDWPTDVLSFVHDLNGKRIEGEIIVSGDTAIRQAQQYQWQPTDELLLYIIHGALHLIGHDDHSEEDLAKMRAAEQRHLKRFGLVPQYETDGQRALQSTAKTSVQLQEREDGA